MKTNFDEYVEITEFLSKVRDKVNDKFYVDVPDIAIVLILKEYEEFKKRMEDV